jgi:hypothetical protein
MNYPLGFPSLFGRVASPVTGPNHTSTSATSGWLDLAVARTYPDCASGSQRWD